MVSKVLVVDDSAVMRAMIVKALKKNNGQVREVLEAENGVDGLRILDEHPVDLVMMDVSMPIMTGDVFLRALRENPATSKTPVVVVTSGSTRKPREHFATLQAAYVTKPFSADTIHAAVESACQAVA